jgi:hypothetical protein
LKQQSEYKMANQWFKFYGGEYLTDPKVRSFTACERQCWTVLLCHASISDCPGIIKHLTEKQLMIDAGVDPFKPEWKETEGVLQKFTSIENHMIQIDDNGMITILNWNKKQEKSLTPYERIKRHRMRNDNGMITHDNNDNADDNARREEKRIDKKREGDTPSDQNNDFFLRGKSYAELLDIFSKDKNRQHIEKEFQKFTLYWTEPNKSGSKVKWEQQSTFDVKRRLFTWLNRSFETKKPSINTGRGLA